MQEITEMRWLLDQLTNRRINDQVIADASKFGAVFLDHMLRSGVEIDNDYITRNSIKLAKSMMAAYVDEKLI